MVDPRMKIQLSQTRIIPDAVTVWNQPGPEVDLVMDLHNLGFREGSIKEMYSFHVLEHLFVNEITPAIKNWFKCLASSAQVWMIVNDFEFIARSYISGDIPIQTINEGFSTPTQITRDLLVSLTEQAGFKSELMRVWHVDINENLKKKDFELIVSAQKHGK